MAIPYDPDHLRILAEGVDTWNEWRTQNPKIEPNLRQAPLGGKRLNGINLREANLNEAILSNTQLREAHLEGAKLNFANLEGANLKAAHLEGTSLRGALLGGTDLRLAFFSNTTDLDDAHLSSQNGKKSAALLVDVDWDSVNLGVIDWEEVRILGDERLARDGREDTESYRDAMRAYRQLSMILRGQGLGEEADRFAYNALTLQRIVWRRQRKWPKYLFSHFLDRLAGYGYKPGHTLAVYAGVIAVFTVLYLLIPDHSQNATSSVQWSDALLLSLINFQGRIQQPGTIISGSVRTWIAAIESMLGLLIELSFIATFTQRFFGKQ